MKGNFTSDLSSVTPDAVILQKVELFNHKGLVKDIKDLVSDITIQESLYLPALICEVTINESVNLFEDLKIIGQERIVIEFQKKPLGANDFQIFTFTFIVTEYPAFVKSLNQTSQAYSLRATTPFAYMSRFKKISREYREATSLEIVRLVNTDLEHTDGFLSIGEESSEHRGVFTLQHPLQAIEFLRKNTYDENGAPFFFFQTFDKVSRFVSLSHLISDKNPVFNTYRDVKGFGSDIGTEEDYKQRAKRIVKFNSEINMSKLFQAEDGAFASRNYSLDYTTKTYDQRIYDYNQSANISNTLGKKPVLSNTFGLGSQNSTLNTLPDSHCEYISTNSGAYPGLKNYSNNLYTNIHRLNAYNTLLSNISHQIEVAGDFFLNPGKKINLELPKAIDQEIYNKWKSGEVDDVAHIDRHLSGDYLVVSTIHTFTVGSNGSCSHMSSMEINKDSFTIDI